MRDLHPLHLLLLLKLIAGFHSAQQPSRVALSLPLHHMNGNMARGPVKGSRWSDVAELAGFGNDCLLDKICLVIYCVIACVPGSQN